MLYLLNAFYFPVLLFYSVDACPPQRTYVFNCSTVQRIIMRIISIKSAVDKKFKSE